jgi:hypothetical protein
MKRTTAASGPGKLHRSTIAAHARELPLRARDQFAGAAIGGLISALVVAVAGSRSRSALFGS